MVLILLESEHEAEDSMIHCISKEAAPSPV